MADEEACTSICTLLTRGDPLLFLPVVVGLDGTCMLEGGGAFREPIVEGRSEDVSLFRAFFGEERPFMRGSASSPSPPPPSDTVDTRKCISAAAPLGVLPIVSRCFPSLEFGLLPSVESKSVLVREDILRPGSETVVKLTEGSAVVGEGTFSRRHGENGAGIDLRTGRPLRGACATSLPPPPCCELLLVDREGWRETLVLSFRLREDARSSVGEGFGGIMIPNTISCIRL